jgi:hypothetical protein
VTLVTLQDGKIVLRDGQVGTEQACCCQDCAVGFLFCSNSNITEESRDAEIAALQQEIQNANVLSEIENAGYANARVEISFATLGFGFTLRVLGDCCGGVDEEAEPTSIMLEDFFVSLLCTGQTVDIYPCNPLP